MFLVSSGLMHCCVEVPVVSLPMPNLMLPSGLSVPLPSVSLPYMPAMPGSMGTGIPPGVSLATAPTMPAVNLANVSLTGLMPTSAAQLDPVTATASQRKRLSLCFMR